MRILDQWWSKFPVSELDVISAAMVGASTGGAQDEGIRYVINKCAEVFRIKRRLVRLRLPG